MKEEQTPASDATQTQITNPTLAKCPQCGLQVSPGMASCPNDGTSLNVQPADVSAGIGGTYRLGRIIGSGGMGVVYEGHHPIINRKVAVKMIHTHLLSELMVRRFQQEGRAASQLDHANLLRIFDFGVTPLGQPYMVMEFLEGQSLSKVLKDKGKLDVDVAIDIFIQACDGLSHAHARGVLHRDLKPSNFVLLGDAEKGYTLRIVDFGIAKVLADDEERGKLTQTGELIGSPFYMSPEQCKGESADYRSDIYALGCVIYETLTGSPPFKDDNQMAVIMAHINEEPSSLYLVCQDKAIPPMLESVVRRTLAKRPENRYQSMGEMKTDLIKAKEELNDPRLARPREQLLASIAARKSTITWTKLHTLLSLAAVAGIAIGAVLGSFVHVRADKAPSNAEMPGGQSDESSPVVIRVRFLELLLKRLHTERTNVTDDDLKVVESGVSPLDRSFMNIDLSGSKVSDVAMRYVTAVKNIKTLNITNTAITDYGLDYIGRMATLSTLNLSGTRITGNGLRRLSALTELTQLILDEKQLTRDDFNVKGLFVNLRELHILRSWLSDDAFQSAKFAKLQILNLTDCPLRRATLASMKKLKNLRQLDLRSTGLSSLDELPRLPRLENLILRNNPIKDISRLERFQTLKSLDIENTLIAAESLSMVAKLPALESLDLERTAVSDKSLAYLQSCHNLNHLDLSFTGISDDGMECLEGLPKLSTLTLKGTEITNACTGSLSELPALETLDVRFTDLTDKGFIELAKLPKLKTIYVYGCQISRETRAALQDMRADLDVSLAKG